MAVGLEACTSSHKINRNSSSSSGISPHHKSTTLRSSPQEQLCSKVTSLCQMGMLHSLPSTGMRLPISCRSLRNRKVILGQEQRSRHRPHRRHQSHRHSRQLSRMQPTDKTRQAHIGRRRRRTPAERTSMEVIAMLTWLHLEEDQTPTRHPLVGECLTDKPTGQSTFRTSGTRHLLVFHELCQPAVQLQAIPFFTTPAPRHPHGGGQGPPLSTILDLDSPPVSKEEVTTIFKIVRASTVPSTSSSLRTRCEADLLRACDRLLDGSQAKSMRACP